MTRPVIGRPCESTAVPLDARGSNSNGEIEISPASVQRRTVRRCALAVSRHCAQMAGSRQVADRVVGARSEGSVKRRGVLLTRG